jgi:Flp pilus assembly protein TadD
MKLRLVALILFVVTAARAGPQGQPDDAKAHIDRGTALLEKGDLDGATGEYREAIRLKPDVAEARYGLGLALKAKGERQAALEEYRKAVELDPKNDAFRGEYERLAKELKK